MKLPFLLFLVLQISVPVCAQTNTIAFDHLTSAQGLSHGTVNCITQDREGFMWFGTKAGLNRYDGYSFQVYEHDPASASSISDNTIWSVCEDQAGALWIGTSQGLNKFDKRTNTFRRFNPNNKQRVTNNNIRYVFEDRSGTLWLGTPTGLNKFDKATATFTLYEHDSERDAWTHNAIHTIYEDRAGNLWVGTNQGLSWFDRKTGQFRRFSPAERTTNASLAFPDAVKAIYEDRSGVLWVGTTGNGLQRFDRRTHTFEAYHSDSTDLHSLSDNSILSLCEDSFGALWIATERGGLNRMERGTGQFTHYLHDPTNAQSISRNGLISLYQDRFKTLWVGTYAGGINKVDLLRKRFAHFKHEPSVKSSLLDDYVYALFSDHTGAVWIGNSTGLSRLDRTSGTFTHYPYNHHSSQYSATDVAHSLYEDHSANLWLGLAGAGLKKFDSVHRTFTTYVHNPADSSSLSNNFVKAILEDRQGALWIGTQNGLCRLDPMSGKFTTYKPSLTQRLNINCLLEEQPGILWLATDKDGLMRFDTQRKTFVRYDMPGSSAQTSNQDANLICLHQDRTGILWLSTESGQFYRFDRKTTTFTLITHPEDLAKTVINGILEDDQGNLWLSTLLKGIIKFNPTTRTARHYDVTDGLQGNEFNRAFCQNATGEMYFGGNNGFNVFHPDSIRDNPYAPPVVIRGFKVFDQPRSFSRDPIVLPHSDNFISFDFAALHYALPEKNQYAYRLEGVDKDWVQAGSRHEAPYTNLDPGEYVLRVKAANYDGIWNEQGAAIHIVINPPWWRTWWAYLLYGLLVAGLLYTLWQYTVSRERLKNNLKLKSLESEKLQELDRMKSRFFTNVSHEFRTPLTLILNPLENMLSGKVDEHQSRAYYPVMYRNGKRLLGLINQLLDLSKLEAGNMVLAPTPGDLSRFIKGNVSAFASFAESHQAKLRFHSTPDSIRTSFDADKLEKIMYNLLSNAFKFTPEQGEVAVSVALKPKAGDSDAAQWIEIQVKDNGIGIPSEQLEKVFDRFYQVDNSHTRRFEGTGIGLALTKELVELHGGEIRVSSEPGAGTCFTVELPLTEVNEEWPDVLLDHEAAFTYPGNRQPVDTRNTTNDLTSEQASLLLIVEDNADIRTYLRHTFDATYRIVEAADGVEGLKLATEAIPDLIISDWMMPEMDGRTMCSRLKVDERTSHIPVILLTAKAAMENKLEGLETGADDYLTKPFHTEELVVRVKNLLKQRKRLRERFSQAFTLPAPALNPVSTTGTPGLDSPLINDPTLAIPAIDEKFLQRVISIIEAHLSDSELDVGFFEKEMGLSRVQLFRKIKAITDQTPGDFIRNFRLKKAAALLALGQGNVSEVAYQVGFTHLSYFTRSFRKVYGMTPSEYMAVGTPPSELRK